MAYCHILKILQTSVMVSIYGILRVCCQLPIGNIGVFCDLQMATVVYMCAFSLYLIPHIDLYKLYLHVQNIKSEAIG